MGVAVFYVGIVLLALPITVIGGNFTVFYHEWVDDAKLEDDIRATLLADAHALDSPAIGGGGAGGAGALGSREPPLGGNEGLAAALELPKSPDRMKITFRHEDEAAVEDRAFVTNRRRDGSSDPQNNSSRALGALGAIVAAASGGEKGAVV